MTSGVSHSTIKGLCWRDPESRSKFHIKQKALILVEELRREIEKSDRDDLIQTTSKHVQARIAVFKTLSNCNEISLVPKRKIAPNENNENQMHFYSTKRNRKIARSIISKPSVSESTGVKQTLVETEPIFCGKCMMENGGNSTIQWLNCDTYSVWLHLSCTGANPKITMTPSHRRLQARACPGFARVESLEIHPRVHMMLKQINYCCYRLCKYSSKYGHTVVSTMFTQDK